MVVNALSENPRRVLLHVGTHRTGTTSIQHFLRDHNEDVLSKVGASFPDGFLIPAAHSELPLLCIRPERTWPARIRLPGTQDERWLATARRHVRSDVQTSTDEVLVYSHEDLSYLRFDDEFERLRALFVPREVTVVVALRDKRDFLRSYGEQLAAMGFGPSDDPTSFAYLEPDSWLLDHDALVEGYRRHFGTEHVVVLDYDEMLRTDGSAIPAVAALLGISPTSLPSLDEYFFNPAGAHIRASEAQLADIRLRVRDQSR
jgi:hypothetical protein